MTINIYKKLMVSYLGLAVLVLIAGFAGISMVRNVAQSSAIVIQEKVPLKDVDMEAVLTAEKALSGCRNYLLAEQSDLEGIESEINEYLGDFDMFVSMVKYGTESEEFKKSPAGAMYVKDGLDIRVPRGTGNMQELINKIEADEALLSGSVANLIKTHNDRVQYTFFYNGVSYDLSGFLYAADVKHRHWLKSLQESVEYETQFSGATDPTKCFYGKWYQTFKTRDKELEKLLSEFKTDHDKFHQAGEKVITAERSRQPSLLTRVERYATKVEAELVKLEKYSEKIIAKLEQEERATMATLFEIGEKLIANLDKLEDVADKGMMAAMDDAKSAKRRAGMILIILMIVAVAAALALGFSIAQSITVPLSEAVGIAENMAKGDFTGLIENKRHDETGILAEALNKMSESLRDMFKDISSGMMTLASSSEQLTGIALQMAEGSEQTSAKSNTVATATEEMSSNMASVAKSSERASTNVNQVATATEQMMSTVNEIAQNSEKARSITGDAVSQAQRASERVDELGNSAHEISKVTEVITAISEQTNLLALNATIEAARAGDAGKGFAVVANEIKELASQTAGATQEIKEKIKGIQESTNDTVSEIKQISQIINNVNEIVSTIATAVEEQSVTTRDIATNASQASQGIQEVNDNVVQSSNVAVEVAKDIAKVNLAAEEMSKNSAQVNKSIGDLNRVAEQLNDMVGRFRV
ncbi:MAG: methyl-accepting chemotaxis protein [bacterium]